MSSARLRSLLYALARLLGDFSAIEHHRVGRRIRRRIAGRLAARLLARIR